MFPTLTMGSDVSDVDHGKFGNTGAAIMGSTADKASGLANEAAGKAKQGIGNVVGSDKLKAEGAAQELKGDAQKAIGDAKAAVKDATNQTCLSGCYIHPQYLVLD
jgi:uncharacterized protein YjbJ (UPF0337 family)